MLFEENYALAEDVVPVEDTNALAVELLIYTVAFVLKAVPVEDSNTLDVEFVPYAVALVKEVVLFKDINKLDLTPNHDGLGGKSVNS